MKTHDDRLPFKILFLCTGNSARSIFGEYLIRRIGRDRFESYSAGSDPVGSVNPFALKILSELYHIDASGARSKSWTEYKDIKFDFVITVCDNAKENCPYFPGKATRFHENFPDPAKAQGTEEEILNEFRKVRDMIKKYSENFVKRNL